jgi:UDP-N-acetylmuramoylalanine--D-glutamate ligase
MNCIVIGAGNAGRPVARILNHVGNKVRITDSKNLEKFPEKVQKTLLKMEEEGVELQLGSNTPDFNGMDSAYVSPAIPKKAPIMEGIASKIENKELKLISNEDVSCIINDLIDIDTIGITGTVGKTSTSHAIYEIFKNAGYKVWLCSSRMGNLLSETIIDGIVKGLPKENDIAVLEIPHGTLGIMFKVHLKVAVLTNIYIDHLDEFDNSMEKYVARKRLITCSSDVLVAGAPCRKYVEDLDDTVFYCFNESKSASESTNIREYNSNDTSKKSESEHEKPEHENPKCPVSGYYKNGTLGLKYNLKGVPHLSSGESGELKTQFKPCGYYLENSVGAAAAALCYGLDKKAIEHGLSKFNGVPGRMEYVGKYNGRDVYIDPSHVIEGFIKTLSLFPERTLVVLVENLDTANSRDKQKLGEVIGRYADVMICSAYNETMNKLDRNAVQEIFKGAKDSNALKIGVDDLKTAGEVSIKYSKPGDVIIHVGPGAITTYDSTKFKMMSGIEEGCKKYE